MGIFDRFGRLARVQSDGTVELRLGEAERGLLTTLLPQLRALLVDEAGDATTGPNDPLLERLFPDARPDDADGGRESGEHESLAQEHFSLPEVLTCRAATMACCIRNVKQRRTFYVAGRGY